MHQRMSAPAPAGQRPALDDRGRAGHCRGHPKGQRLEAVRHIAGGVGIWRIEGDGTAAAGSGSPAGFFSIESNGMFVERPASNICTTGLIDVKHLGQSMFAGPRQRPGKPDRTTAIAFADSPGWSPPWPSSRPDRPAVVGLRRSGRRPCGACRCAGRTDGLSGIETLCSIPAGACAGQDRQRRPLILLGEGLLLTTQAASRAPPRRTSGERPR